MQNVRMRTQGQSICPYNLPLWKHTLSLMSAVVLQLVDVDALMSPPKIAAAGDWLPGVPRSRQDSSNQTHCCSSHGCVVSRGTSSKTVLSVLTRISTGPVVCLAQPHCSALPCSSHSARQRVTPLMCHKLLRGKNDIALLLLGVLLLTSTAAPAAHRCTNPSAAVCLLHQLLSSAPATADPATTRRCRLPAVRPMALASVLNAHQLTEVASCTCCAGVPLVL